MELTKAEQALLDTLAEGIRERLGRVPVDEAENFDVDQVAAAMLSAMPVEHPFEDLGPFYDTGGLVTWLDITRQALHQKVKSRQLLRLSTGDGQNVYPAWQFTPTGRTVPGLGPVLKILLPATDEWTAAIWLTTPSERLGGRPAVELLSTGRPDLLEAVTAAASTDASRWVQ